MWYRFYFACSINTSAQKITIGITMSGSTTSTHVSHQHVNRTETTVAHESTGFQIAIGRKILDFYIPYTETYTSTQSEAESSQRAQSRRGGIGEAPIVVPSACHALSTRNTFFMSRVYDVTNRTAPRELFRCRHHRRTRFQRASPSPDSALVDQRRRESINAPLRSASHSKKLWISSPCSLVG